MSTHTRTPARTHEAERLDARRNLAAIRRARRALWRVTPLGADALALAYMDALVAHALERVDACEHPR
jgi:hypothetical protein